jgi:hypothetical protein
MVVLICGRDAEFLLVSFGICCRGADETLSANIEVVFVNWTEVHVHPWI